MMEFASLAPTNPAELRDADLQLEFSPGMSSFPLHPIHKVPTYHFRMLHSTTAKELGGIRLRVGSTPHVELYAGHIGYNVHEPHRGHRYAARSVRLLIPFARRLGLNPLWITCDPENFASRRTLELAGFEFVEIVSVPKDCVIFQSGHPRKCRYKLDLFSQHLSPWTQSQ
jgi:predicted acetyltransferase